MKWTIQLRCGNCEDGLVAYLIADGPDDNVTEGFECLDCNGKGYTEHTGLYASVIDLLQRARGLGKRKLGGKRDER